MATQNQSVSTKQQQQQQIEEPQIYQKIQDDPELPFDYLGPISLQTKTSNDNNGKVSFANKNATIGPKTAQPGIKRIWPGCVCSPFLNWLCCCGWAVLLSRGVRCPKVLAQIVLVFALVGGAFYFMSVLLMEQRFNGMDRPRQVSDIRFDEDALFTFEFFERQSASYPLLSSRIATTCLADDPNRLQRQLQLIDANLFPAPPTGHVDHVNYVTLDYEICYRLGNQIYRFATLYGIGRDHGGRRPIINEKVRNCISFDEYERYFPVLARHTLFYNDTKETAQQTDSRREFAREHAHSDCCKFFDPGQLDWWNITRKYLLLGGNYMQHYRYFHRYRPQIRDFLRCSGEACRAGIAAAKHLFGDDHQPKLCVHTRRGDFAYYGIGSDPSFTELAAEYISNGIRLNGKGPVSLVVFGDDPAFIDSLRFNRSIIQRVYRPDLDSRAMDWCFARLFCDSMLLSAPTSSFGWWMAYLLTDRTPVFYDAEENRLSLTKDGYLAEWTPLIYNNSTSALVARKGNKSGSSATKISNVASGAKGFVRIY